MHLDLLNVQRPPVSMREKAMATLWRLAGGGPALDKLLTRRLPHLKCLPERQARNCIPRFEESAVVVTDCPLGEWSTPLIDTVVLAKCAIGFRSKHILEIGSYLGYTAKLLAENTGEGTRITTIDIDPQHGSAYRGTEVEAKIDRVVGPVSSESLQGRGPFDLIFVDADHRFESVVNDTRVAFELLSENGIVVWHDYQQENHFHGLNGVPEFLGLLQKHIPIVSVPGTYLAVHSRFPEWKTAEILAREIAAAGPSISPWEDSSMRG